MATTATTTTTIQRDAISTLLLKARELHRETGDPVHVFDGKNGPEMRTGAKPRSGKRVWTYKDGDLHLHARNVIEIRRARSLEGN